VLGNDTDSDGDPLTAVLGAGPANGSLILNADGSFDYTPDADFNGSDSFTYVANDGSVNSVITATVTLTVNPLIDPPVANDDPVWMTQDTSATIDVAMNDTDADGNLDPSSANTACGTCSNPTNGTLVNNGDGTFDYTPNPGYTGSDSFVYEICDTGPLCDTASVVITLLPAANVLVGVGDIADCNDPGDEETADLLDGIAGTVITLGDNAYDDGTDEQFASCYHPSWGRHKARTKPSVGNHDYFTPGATGYFNYFGAAAGDPAEGWYSYDVGDWHIIVLNSNCSEVGGCELSSPQGQWLQADLAANPSACTLAYWHHPRFDTPSSGPPTPEPELLDFWQALYDAEADVVLVSHRHNYERFALQDPNGVADSQGLRQFVVGTGGKSLSPFGPSIAPNSEVRDNSTFGVLKLTLRPTSYDWEFIPVAGGTFTDSGSGACVGIPNQPPVAVNDAYATDEDVALNVAAPGVLGNDSDPDGDSLTAVVDTGPSGGSLRWFLQLPAECELQRQRFVHLLGQ
jgi:hypothetical protein